MPAKASIGEILTLCSLLVIGMAGVGCDGTSVGGKTRVTQLPFIPIPLNFDSTVVHLDDFFERDDGVDSVLWEGSTLLPIHNSNASSLGHVVVREQPDQQLSHLQIWANGDHYEVPVFPSTLKRGTFTFNGAPEAQTVQIMGAFNGWNRNDLFLEQSVNGWQIELALSATKHPYQLSIDGEWMADPSNPHVIPNGFGAFNSILDWFPSTEAVHLSVNQARNASARPARFVIQTSPGADVYVFWDRHLVTHTQTDSKGAAEITTPSASLNIERSHLRIWSVQARSRSQDVLIPLEYGQPITNPSALNRTDRHGMIMYFLMVDRFKNGDVNNDHPVNDPGIHPSANYLGGDLTGVAQSIAYFDDLGVNTVWISPITQNPQDAWGYWQDPSTDLTSKFSGYHGYWPVSSTQIDNRFGTAATLDSLINGLHASNMNVLVDYVANHVHQEHPIYKQHPDWVTPLYLPDGSMNTERWDDHRLTTWFDTFLPTLDLERQEVYETMTDSAVWWVTNTEIDGFRHDATKHIPEVFWRTLTRKIKDVRGSDHAPLFQIGETYGNPQLINRYISNGMLDAQFDFNLYDALVLALGKPESNWKDLVDIANQSIATYGSHHLMGNITGNQDRPRFTSLADGGVRFDEDTKLAGWTRQIEHRGKNGFERMKWLMAYLMSAPGIPCIYYGDELAFVGGNDPDNRRMMRFTDWTDEERNVREWTQEWINLRKSRMSLMYGQTEHTIHASGLLIVTRRYLSETTIVVFNRSDVAQSLPMELDGLERLTSYGKEKDHPLVIEPQSCAAYNVAPR